MLRWHTRCMNWWHGIFFHILGNGICGWRVKMLFFVVEWMISLNDCFQNCICCLPGCDLRFFFKHCTASEQELSHSRISIPAQVFATLNKIISVKFSLNCHQDENFNSVNKPEELTYKVNFINENGHEPKKIRLIC